MSEPTLGVLVLSCCFLVANRFAAGPAIVFGITNPALLKKRLLSSGKLCASVGASISVETAMRAHTAGIQLQRRREFAAARRAACSLEPLRFGVGVSYAGETSANRNRECTQQEAFTDAGVEQIILCAMPISKQNRQFVPFCNQREMLESPIRKPSTSRVDSAGPFTASRSQATE